eukprot:jgi/Mesen1/9308/ME000060S08745
MENGSSRARDHGEDDFFGNDFGADDLHKSDDIQQEWRAREAQFRSVGYRDGVTAGKNASVQEGFNAGYIEAVEAAQAWGQARGAACTFAALKPGLQELLVQSGDARRRLLAANDEIRPVSSQQARLAYYQGLLASERQQQQQQQQQRARTPPEGVAASSAARVAAASSTAGSVPAASSAAEGAPGGAAASSAREGSAEGAAASSASASASASTCLCTQAAQRSQGGGQEGAGSTPGAPLAGQTDGGGYDSTRTPCTGGATCRHCEEAGGAEGAASEGQAAGSRLGGGGGGCGSGACGCGARGGGQLEDVKNDKGSHRHRDGDALPEKQVQVGEGEGQDEEAAEVINKLVALQRRVEAELGAFLS